MTRREPIAAAIILAGMALSLTVNWPGHMSDDSVTQLLEGRTGVYGAGGHPPVMSWLLGLTDGLSPGPGLFVLMDTALIALALVALLSLGGGGGWRAAGLALVACAFPQLLIYPAIVWKDVLFAGSALAGFAALAWSTRLWRNRAARLSCLASAAILLSLATLTRQNGGIILPFAAAALAWVAAKANPGGALRGLGHGVALLGVCASVVLASTAALNTRNENPQAISGAFVGLRTYDLVGALTIEPHIQLSVLHARAPRFEALLRTTGVAAYSPARADTLEPVLDEAPPGTDIPALVSAQWRDLFSTDPLLLVRVRAKAFQWVLLTPDHSQCVLIHTGIDGDPSDLSDLGMARRESARDGMLWRYAMAFASTPVYSHAAYALVGLGLVIGLLLRRRPEDVVVSAMVAGALAFAVSFAAISIACDYRYLYDLDLAVIATSLYAAATWGSRSRASA